jgi:hypothetical protein
MPRNAQGESVKSLCVSVLAVAGTLALIEAAEPDTFVVTTTQDSGAGSFRWAIEQSNSHVGPDTVVFAIPTSDPGYDPQLGVWTIETDVQQSPFRYCLEDAGTFVDGFSQARFVGGDPNPYGPEIELEGPSTGTPCIDITDSDDHVVQGLCIHHFNGAAIQIKDWHGVAENNVVLGCYLNVDPTGSRREGEGHQGIMVHSTLGGVRIGGDAPEDRNVIAGASNHDVYCVFSGNVEIINNHIGTDRTGTVELGGGLGTMDLSGAKGPILVRDNVIGGHWLDLVDISSTDPDSGFVTFVGNRVGVGLDGTAMGGDHDNIIVYIAPGHVFRENVIAHSQMFHGIYVAGASTDYVTISRNSIYECRGLGIQLANYPNEYGYVDVVDGLYGSGVNEEIDPCLCDSVVTTDESVGGTTTAYFTCMRNCIVEVFIGDGYIPDPCSEPGYGEVPSGKTYLGDAQETHVGLVWSTYEFSISPALTAGTVRTPRVSFQRTIAQSVQPQHSAALSDPRTGAGARPDVRREWQPRCHRSGRAPGSRRARYRVEAGARRRDTTARRALSAAHGD